MFRPPLQKFADGIQQDAPLASPRVTKVHFLTAFHRFRHFEWMRKGELDFSGEIVCIAQLEKD